MDKKIIIEETKKCRKKKGIDCRQMPANFFPRPWYLERRITYANASGSYPFVTDLLPTNLPLRSLVHDLVPSKSVQYTRPKPA